MNDKTISKLRERLSHVTATSRKYGAGHVLAAGAREIAAATKAGWVHVEDVPGCGVVFRATEVPNAVEQAVSHLLKNHPPEFRYEVLRIARASHLTEAERLGFVCDFIAGDRAAAHKAGRLNLERKTRELMMA